MVAETIQLVHPLLAFEVSFIESWDAWKKWWQGTLPIDLRDSLLYLGLRVHFQTQEEYRDCVVLYLGIADGYCSFDSFTNTGEHGRDLRYTTFGKDVKVV